MADKILSRRRGFVRADVTRTITSVNQSLETASRNEKLTLIARLDTLKSDLRDLDRVIFDKMTAADATDEQSQEEYNRCAAYEENIFAAIHSIKSTFGSSETRTGTENPPNGGSNSLPITKVKIPQMPLPTYSHQKGEDLTCLLYTSPSPRDKRQSRMPSSA